MTDKHLVIENLPSGNFDVEIEVDVKPKENTSLEGLYNSSGTFCTQCEAEGFRGITYFYDRYTLHFACGLVSASDCDSSHCWAACLRFAAAYHSPAFILHRYFLQRIFACSYILAGHLLGCHHTDQKLLLSIQIHSHFAMLRRLGSTQTWQDRKRGSRNIHHTCHSDDIHLHCHDGLSVIPHASTMDRVCWYIKP